MYYLWATLLVVANALAWASNLVTLPGNWIIVALTALFAWLVPAADGKGVSWWTVLVLVVLAAVGEVIEFAAGAAGAAQRGGSKRGMALAMLGAMAGSIAGAFVTLPIPVVGPLVGALLGGAAGAFAGAYLGESWKGRTTGESLGIGKAAFVGRLWGTLGKLAVGTAMWVIATLSAFLSFG